MISGEPGQVLTNSDVTRLRIGRKLLKTLSATKFIHRGPRLARHSIIAPEQNLKMCRTRRYSNPVPVCTSDRMHRPRLFFRGRSRCWWRYNPAQNGGETVARTCSRLEAETKRCEWQSWRADQNGQPVPGVIERGGLYDSDGVLLRFEDAENLPCLLTPESGRNRRGHCYRRAVTGHIDIRFDIAIGTSPAQDARFGCPGQDCREARGVHWESV